MEKTRKQKNEAKAPVSEKVFVYFFFPLLLLSVLFHLVSVYWGTPYLWGIHFLYFFPRWLAWAMTIVTLILFIPAVNRSILRFLGPLFEVPGRILGKLNKYLLFVFAGLASIPIFWALRTKLFLLGDGYFKLEALSTLHITRTEPLDGILHHQLYKLLISTFPQADPSLVYTVPSVICGGIFLFMLLVISDLLGKTNFHKVLIFSTLITLGSIELFFGYVEAYTTLLTGLTLFLLLSLLCIRGRTNLLFIFLVLMVSTAIHVSGIVLLPAFLYLALWKWSRQRRKFPDLSTALSLLGCALIVFVAIWKVFLAPGGGNRFAQFLPIVSSTGYGFTMFSWEHLVEFLNQLLLLSPAGIILFVFFLFYYLKSKSFNDPAINFLAFSSFFGLLLIFIYNSRWGNSDWDLRALPGLFFSLFGILLFIRWGERWLRFKVYALLVIAVSFYHVVPWVLLNADAKKSLDRYVLTAVNDKHILSASSGGLWTVGRVLDKAGLIKEAEDVYRLGMEKNPGRVVYCSLLGNNLYAQGRYDEAIGCLEKGLELEPGSQEIRLSLAQNYLKKNELDKALPYLLSLKDDLHDDRLYVVIMAKACMNLNRWADAGEVVRRFLAKKPESAEMLGLLGLSFYMLGDKSEARRLWEKALILDPNDRNAKAGLRELNASPAEKDTAANTP
jgi:tetratricopeptide (TPR) repeat protein